MTRLSKLATIAVPAVMLVGAPAFADMKTRDRTSVQLGGALGGFLNKFGGKTTHEGVESMTAVKGNRKASINEATGKIIDLSEEKVYDLDMKKKTYTVTTFDELRRRMREQAEKAKEQSQKEEPGQTQQQQQKPTKEYEVDFDVKDTGQKKQIAGYDTHETIVTITVREKGKKLEESGGLVMTNDMWLGPKIPQLKENAEFEMRYWKQLEGPQMVGDISPEQMAAVIAMFPLLTKASERLAKDSDKLSGTPLDVTTTVDSVKSPDQMTQAQQQQSQSGGGGIGGMLAKKIMKQEPPKARSTVMTTHHEVLEVATSVAASDLAIPADFKEKK
jgi:hypothetical protein